MALCAALARPVACWKAAEVSPDNLDRSIWARRVLAPSSRVSACARPSSLPSIVTLEDGVGVASGTGISGAPGGLVPEGIGMPVLAGVTLAFLCRLFRLGLVAPLRLEGGGGGGAGAVTGGSLVPSVGGGGFVRKGQ